MGVWKVLALACVIISQCQSDLHLLNPSSTLLENSKKSLLQKYISKNCICFPKFKKDKLLPNALKPEGGTLERFVIYLYKDKKSNEVSTFIPNNKKQAIFPDLPQEDGDLLIPNNNKPVNFSFLNNLIPASTIEVLPFKLSNTENSIFDTNLSSLNEDDQLPEPIDIDNIVETPLESSNYIKNQIKVVDGKPLLKPSEFVNHFHHIPLDVDYQNKQISDSLDSFNPHTFIPFEGHDYDKPLLQSVEHVNNKPVNVEYLDETPFFDPDYQSSTQNGKPQLNPLDYINNIHVDHQGKPSPDPLHGPNSHLYIPIEGEIYYDPLLNPEDYVSIKPFDKEYPSEIQGNHFAYPDYVSHGEHTLYPSNYPDQHKLEPFNIDDLTRPSPHDLYDLNAPSKATVDPEYNDVPSFNLGDFVDDKPVKEKPHQNPFDLLDIFNHQKPIDAEDQNNPALDSSYELNPHSHEPVDEDDYGSPLDSLDYLEHQINEPNNIQYNGDDSLDSLIYQGYQTFTPSDKNHDDKSLHNLNYPTSKPLNLDFNDEPLLNYFNPDTSNPINSLSLYSLLNQSSQIINLQKYLIFGHLDAVTLRAQVQKILDDNKVTMPINELLTNDNALPKLSLIPVLTEGLNNDPISNKKGDLWHLLVVIVDHSHPPRILGAISLGNLRFSKKNLKLLSLCKKCERLSPCKIKKCLTAEKIEPLKNIIHPLQKKKIVKKPLPSNIDKKAINDIFKQKFVMPFKTHKPKYKPVEIDAIKTNYNPELAVARPLNAFKNYPGKQLISPYEFLFSKPENTKIFKNILSPELAPENFPNKTVEALSGGINHEFETTELKNMLDDTSAESNEKFTEKDAIESQNVLKKLFNSLKPLHKKILKKILKPRSILNASNANKGLLVEIPNDEKLSNKITYKHFNPSASLFNSNDEKSDIESTEETGDNDILHFRILGGNAATSSGTPVVSKGRSDPKND